jgi:hypothetical protein
MMTLSTDDMASTVTLAHMIDMAEGGNEDADLALRLYAATLLDRHLVLPAQLRAYMVRFLRSMRP